MIHVIQYFFRNLFANPPVSLRLIVLLGAILLYGTTGFVYFEFAENPDLSWLDGLWYTLVTMTTVGYGDFFPKTAGGRFLVGWPIMAFGIGLLGYALSTLAVNLISSKSKEARGMSSFTLKDHLIIFNFPIQAKVERIIDELCLDPAFGKSVPIVLVDESIEELPPELQKRGLRYVRGNPVRDSTLTRAGIDHCRHTVILSRDPGDPASDNVNVAIALAIEGRNPAANTVVECVDPASEELLRKAGCDRIVCTSRFDANFLSQELLNPGMQDLIYDLLSAKDGQQIYFVKVGKQAAFGELAKVLREKRHLLLGISSPKGIRLNVPDLTYLEAGDSLITIGPSRIDEL